VPLCQLSDRLQIVVKFAEIFIQRLTLWNEDILHPSIECLGTFDDIQNEKMQTFAAIVLNPFVAKNSEDSSDKDAGSFDSIHEVVKMLVIINLHQIGDQIISRGERLGEFHCKGEWEENVESASTTNTN
jgi:hypothetical protein